MMKNYDLIVVGAGPAGMMGAIEAAHRGCHVAVLERNKEAGRKLKITGGGRCNVTSALDIKDFFDKIPHNSKFLYKAFQNFSNRDLLDLFEERGIAFHREGFKIYPISNESSEIIECLLREMKAQGAELLTDTMMRNFIRDEEGISVNTSRGMMRSKAILLASGGNSFPALGSDWNVHELLSDKIRILPPMPSLVQIHSNAGWITSSMGISVEDASLTVLERDKKVCSLRGAMIFTHSGISGPAVLDASAMITGRALGDIRIRLDLLPEIEEQEITAMLRTKDRNNIVNKFAHFLPKNLLRNIFGDIDDKADFQNMKKAQLKELVDRLKNANVNITGLGTIKEAIVTRGGIDVREIDPSTMALKKMEDVFVAGEMIDVDGFTGGYNLQIAFSTGALAGRSAAQKIADLGGYRKIHDKSSLVRGK